MFANNWRPHCGGVVGSNSPAKIRVGMSLRTGSFATSDAVATFHAAHISAEAVRASISPRPWSGEVCARTRSAFSNGASSPHQTDNLSPHAKVDGVWA
ncbi:hypothetical protein D3C72_1897140 [compost metagenome]